MGLKRVLLWLFGTLYIKAAIPFLGTFKLNPVHWACRPFKLATYSQTCMSHSRLAVPVRGFHVEIALQPGHVPLIVIYFRTGQGSLKHTSTAISNRPQKNLTRSLV